MISNLNRNKTTTPPPTYRIASSQPQSLKSISKQRFWNFRKEIKTFLFPKLKIPQRNKHSPRRIQQKTTGANFSKSEPEAAPKNIQQAAMNPGDG